MFASIDLKSFYASVECVERGLNPLTTNLVVADASRTEKTICLAITPPLKEYGLSGRSRLFEVISKIREVNATRRKWIPNHKFRGKSSFQDELKKHLDYEVDYLVAPPRMKLYMEYSLKIYQIYLKYIAPEDIFVYSIDEVFIDISKYLKMYHMTPEELVTKMILDVLKTTKITATAGLGTNLYLAKVAMDIIAKHQKPNNYGVRIAFLDEEKYKRQLWSHTPITDFWRVGKGYANKLMTYQIYTMGDIAKTAIYNEGLLYKLFGVNAEILIDHSFGIEPVTIDDIKKYKPDSQSLSSGQVLHCAYTVQLARIIVLEMASELALSMASKNLQTDLLVLDIHYDKDSLISYQDEVVIDHYQRKVPKPSHGSKRLSEKTQSATILSDAFLNLYDKIVHKNLMIRKLNLTVGNLSSTSKEKYKQIDLFTNYEEETAINKKQKQEEENIQKALINIKNKYGKNAIFKGVSLLDGATALERNEQIGGHKG